MTGYRLRDGKSFCLVQDAAVFLDVGADRYFRLGSDAEVAFLNLVNRPDLHAAGRLPPELDDIVTATNDPGDRLVPPHAALPSMSLLEAPEDSARPSISAFAPTFVSLAGAAWRLRYRGFACALDHVRRARTPQAERRRCDKHQHARDFLHWRRLAPFTPVCLLDSLALANYLRRAGVPVQLVVGVTLFPFAAHCWVQDADVLFNETLGHAAAHTPILVL